MTIRNAFEQYVKSLSSIYEKKEAESISLLMFEERVGLTKSDLILRGEESMSEVKANDLTWKLLRLMKGEPVQYVLGYCYWFGMKLKVNKHVLIPRPETEELVEWIIKENQTRGDLKILDIGAGSGCIAIALKKNIPTSEVFAMDISKDALQVARENAEQNQAEVSFIFDDILYPKSDHSSSPIQYSLIVSNPPYVPESEKPGLHENVLNFEPAAALFVPNTNPLIFYNAIIEFATRHLAVNGELFFEVNPFYATDVAKQLQSNGFSQSEIRTDLSGKYRMIRASRQ